MDDLISRQKVLALAKDLVIPYPDGSEYRHRCIDATEIKLLPSEHLNIVRCRDCKWWDRVADGSKIGYCHAIKHCYHTRNWEVSIYRKYDADFFCADGEMRTEEEEEEQDETN